MPAGTSMATAASIAALLGLVLAAPARGVRLADTQAYIDCAASTTCTSLCAQPPRARTSLPSSRACAGARRDFSRLSPTSPSSHGSAAGLSSSPCPGR